MSASAPRTIDGPWGDKAGHRPIAQHRIAYDGMIWQIARDTVDFADGVRFDREYLQHPGAVAVIALDAEDRVLLIRQYRHPAGGTLWEIPAGLRDHDGESDAEAARRELAEETGHTAAQLRTLIDLRPSPGGSDEVIRVYLATGLREAEDVDFERTEEEAELHISWAPLFELVQAILRGDLTSGTLVAGVMALAAHRAAGGRDEELRPAEDPWPPSVPR